jgi:ABC-2 type transport system ATP-binding protein
MISLRNVTMKYPLTKRYRQLLFSPFRRIYVTALSDVSLAIMAGERVGILGPNGAGKTTLLKIIAGLLYPLAGTAEVGGYDTRGENHAVRRRVGFVLNEERSFYWRLTGLQNLEFFGALDNLSGQKLQRRTIGLLELVGLKDAAKVRVSDYSCGMRQRLAIARGLLAEPEVLILDEPTKSLDPLGAASLRSLISREIHPGFGKTLIIATHQTEEAEELCDRIGILLQGRLVDYTPIQEIERGPGGLAGHYRRIVSPTGAIGC